MNTDKKISFYNLQKLENLTHFRPAFQTETCYFEYIAQRNNIKTSNYFHRMTEHYFPLKIQSIQAQLQVLNSPEKQPRSTDGLVTEK